MGFALYTISFHDFFSSAIIPYFKWQRGCKTFIARHFQKLNVLLNEVKEKRHSNFEWKIGTDFSDIDTSDCYFIYFLIQTK